MLTALVLIAYVTAFLTVRRLNHDARSAALLAAVILGCFIVISSELLGVMTSISRFNLAITWGLASVFLIILMKALRPATMSTSSALPKNGSERLLLFGLFLIFGAVGITAVLSPPNSWDAMEYHMPRVVMWASNQSLDIYPTPDYGQVVLAPWAELAMLHLYLLAGSDRLVNLVEFFALIGLSIGASAITRSLGGSRLAQIGAAVIAGTIPSGLLEASGAMNTAVGAFWIVTAAYFTLSWNSQQRLSNLIGISGAIGLAILTKGSAYLYLPPILLGCWWLGDNSTRIKLLRHIPIVVLLVIGINGLQFYRFFELTGSPLGLPFPDGGPRLHWVVSNFSLGGGIANVIRELSLHATTPFPTPYHIMWANELTYKIVEWLLNLIGQTANDGNYVWPGGYFKINFLSSNEVYAGANLHLLLSIITGALLVNSNINRQVRIFSCSVLLAFLSFSFVLRWQEWGARHHIVIFALLAPVIAIAIEAAISRRALLAASFTLLFVGTFYAIGNGRRSLLLPGEANIFSHTREELYFTDMHNATAALTILAAEEIRASNCNVIGISSFVDTPDRELVRSPPSYYVYPLMALLTNRAEGTKFHYVDVQNKTRHFGPTQDPHFCAIICLDCKRSQERIALYSSFEAKEFGENIVFFDRSTTSSQK